MSRPALETVLLRVLLVDDSPIDVELLLRHLSRDGFAPVSERVFDAGGMAKALDNATWDVILCDYAMPGFSGPEALLLLRATGKDVPFILVTGTIGEEAAVGMMKAGAQDFLLKDHASRLGPAIRREMREAQGRRQQRADALARIESQRKLETANRQLRLLSGKIMQVQERERELLSRGLHDDVGQALTGLQLQLEALRRRASSPADLKSIDDSVQIVNQVLAQVRDLSLDLRPPQLDILGLTAALRWYAERKVAAVPGLNLDIAAQNLPPLQADIETACFRIAQEAITNVQRHAQATQLSIDVRHDGAQLCVAIRDDGCGFDVHRTYERALRGESLGVLNMQERAAMVGGRVELKSVDGETCILIVLPDVPSRGTRALRDSAPDSVEPVAP
jgi:signal transduction histidine kinase